MSTTVGALRPKVDLFSLVSSSIMSLRALILEADLNKKKELGRKYSGRYDEKYEDKKGRRSGLQ